VEGKDVLCSSSPAIAFNKAAKFGAPLIGKVADAQVQRFIFRVVSTSNAFASEEILEAPKVRTEHFRSALAGDLIDCMERSLETRVMQAKQRVYSVIAGVGGAALNGAVFLTPGWEDGLLR
jgi:hypothetical protein